MPYKTILLHVDDAKNAPARIELAAQLAVTEGAHLIGLAMTGITRYRTEAVMVDNASPDMQQCLDILRKRAEQTIATYEDVVRRVGVTSFEKQLYDDDAARGINLYSRYSDLIVMGQYDPQGTTSPAYADLPETAAMSSACPVLIIPHAGEFKSIGQRVLIAWNSSIEAARAVHGALPLLQRAKTIEVAVFNPEHHHGTHGEQPGADVALFLSRHNLKVDVMQEKTETESDVGDALLSLAAGLHSDLLVMGCYGHSRVREVLLGGATRSILRSMTLPVLMSH